MEMTRGDGLLNSIQAGALVGRQPATIRRWKVRGYLQPSGLDEQGRPLYSRDAVRRAELVARENGLRTKGVDPRQQAAQMAARRAAA